MSLQVWLPLNGNLYNQGLNNVSISQSNVTYSNGLVTNQSATFSRSSTSTAVGININGLPLQSKETWSCWFKYDGSATTSQDSSHTILTIGTDWEGIRLNTGGLYIHNDHTTKQQISMSGISQGVWYNVIVTIDIPNNEVVLYKNGSLVGKTNLNSVNTETFKNSVRGIGTLGSSTTWYILGGSISDVRIYDEVLSPFRIKELSKGLSLHYKLSSPANAMTSEGDCSGHGDDGSFNGAKPAVETDTPRNSRCYNFGAATSKMILSKYKHSWTTNFTASVWAKLPNSTSSANYIFTEGRADAVSYGFGIQCTNSSFTARFGNGSIGASNFTANTWHHLALVVDNTSTASFYVDGVLKGSNKPGTLPTYTESNGLGIGGFRYASGNIYPHNGCISDFRLYATALSEKDIKELYNTPITIDDKDVLYGNDFVEEETPVDMKFYKTGVIKKELNYKTTTGYNPKDFIEV